MGLPGQEQNPRPARSYHGIRSAIRHEKLDDDASGKCGSDEVVERGKHTCLIRCLSDEANLICGREAFRCVSYVVQICNQGGY